MNPKEMLKDLKHDFYNEIFSPVSCKDSFRIIMSLVLHYDLELH
jgi:hypothetical protein